MPVVLDDSAVNTLTISTVTTRIGDSMITQHSALTGVSSQA